MFHMNDDVFNVKKMLKIHASAEESMRVRDGLSKDYLFIVKITTRISTLFSLGFGMFFSKILFLHFQIWSLVTRNLLLLPAVYMFFFLMNVIVLYFLKTKMTKKINLLVTQETVTEMSKTQKKEYLANFTKKLPSSNSLFDFAIIDGEFLLFLSVFLGYLFLLSWVFFQGPAMIIDISMEAALVAILTERNSQAMEFKDFFWGYLRRTFVLFFIVYSVSTVALFWLDHIYPGNERLSQLCMAAIKDMSTPVKK
jgi:hypothetical protein